MFTHKELCLIKRIAFYGARNDLSAPEAPGPFTEQDFLDLLTTVERALKDNNRDFVDRLKDRGLDTGHEEWYNS